MNSLAVLGVVLGGLLLRQPLMVILLAATASIHLIWGRGQLEYIVEDMWVGLDKEVILSIPMFLLCGSVMTRGSISRRLVRVMAAITAPLPGGMAVATLLSCAIFAAISGSSVVTMLAIGTVMLPALRDAGYELKFSVGTIMAGGTLGAIIPPSIPMIVYALVTESSVTDLFVAGIGPGLLVALVLSVYAILRNRGMPTQAFDLAELRSSFVDGLWSLLMPVLLLGGIYSGYFTPTEAAAVALAYALVVEGVVHRDLRWRDLYQAVLDTSKLGGSLFPVLAVALSLNLLLTEHRVPQQLVTMMQEYVGSALMFMLLANLLLLLVGCLMTTTEAILVLAPILAPMAEAYGYDKVIFGVIMILNLEIGYLTPPVGLNLIVAMTAFRQPFALLARAAVPFIVLMAGCLVAVVLMPQIATALLD